MAIKDLIPNKFKKLECGCWITHYKKEWFIIPVCETHFEYQLANAKQK